MPPCAGEEWERKNKKTWKQEEKVQVRQDGPGANGWWRGSSEDPEEEEGSAEGKGEEGRETVA